MLVLSRKQDESLLIGDDIEIIVIRIQGNRVNLGVRAPRDVKVLRSEVKTDKTQQASGSVPGSSGSQPTKHDDYGTPCPKSNRKIDGSSTQ